MSDSDDNRENPKGPLQKVPGTFWSYSTWEIAQKTGVSPRQLYYWESIGLLKPSRRRLGTRLFRLYGERELEKLLEIKAWLDMGFSLQGVRKMEKREKGVSPTGATPLGEESHELL